MERNVFLYRLVCTCFALLGMAGNVRGEVMAGPVVADVIRVIDGDTFVADARVWPGQTIRVKVRLRGIDAPEMRSRCADVAKAAAAARDALRKLLGEGPVEISAIGADKFYGRVIADVATPAAGHVGSAMLAQSHARPYQGGRRAQAECR